MTENSLKRHLNTCMHNLRDIEKKVKESDVWIEFLEKSKCVDKDKKDQRISEIKKAREEMILVYNEMMDELTIAFEQLPHHLTTTMELHYISGFPWEIIAEKLDISPRSVYRRRDLAIRILVQK